MSAFTSAQTKQKLNKETYIFKIHKPFLRIFILLLTQNHQQWIHSNLVTVMLHVHAGNDITQLLQSLDKIKSPEEKMKIILKKYAEQVSGSHQG